MTDVKFRSAKMETGQLIVDIPIEERGKVMKWLRSKKDRDYDLVIKEHRNKRSMEANAYAWVLINKIADALRMPPTEVYRQAIRDVPENNEIMPIKDEAFDKFKQIWEAQGLGWPCVKMGKSKIPGYVTVQAFYGSSTYDSRQFSILIENLTQDCTALGIEVKSPEEVASMLEAVK